MAKKKKKRKYTYWAKVREKKDMEHSAIVKEKKLLINVSSISLTQELLST